MVQQQRGDSRVNRFGRAITPVDGNGVSVLQTGVREAGLNRYRFSYEPDHVLPCFHLRINVRNYDVQSFDRHALIIIGDRYGDSEGIVISVYMLDRHRAGRWIDKGLFTVISPVYRCYMSIERTYVSKARCYGDRASLIDARAVAGFHSGSDVVHRHHHGISGGKTLIVGNGQRNSEDAIIVI